MLNVGLGISYTGKAISLLGDADNLTIYPHNLISTDATDYEITGLTGLNNDGTTIIIRNSGSYLFVLRHLDASSTATNRIFISNAIDLVIYPGDYVFLTYNTTTGYWYCHADYNNVVYDTVPSGRLTLTTATPVPTSDETAKTTIYFTPYRGSVIALYSNMGTGTIKRRPINFSEVSIKLTDTQTGTLSSGFTTVTGLTSTRQLVVGMKVSGTNIPANTVIATVDTATQVTLNNGATGSGSSSLTFKVPASKNLDIFAVDIAGSLVLQFGNFWTNDTTRADGLEFSSGLYRNDMDINSGQYNHIHTKKGLYLGSVRTTATDGETEKRNAGTNTAANQLLWNYFNRLQTCMTVIDTTDSWNYSTASYRQTRAQTSNQGNFLLGISEDMVNCKAYGRASNSTTTGRDVRCGIGLDSTTANSAQLSPVNRVTSGFVTVQHMLAMYDGYIAAGYHYLAWLEYGAGTETQTWYGDNAGDQQNGMKVWIYN
jgi:hypothetical protein